MSANTEVPKPDGEMIHSNIYIYVFTLELDDFFKELNIKRKSIWYIVNRLYIWIHDKILAKNEIEFKVC